jgi:hypothetical protein
MKYFMAFLGIIALVILVFVLVVKGLTGHKAPTTQASLIDYANTSTVVRWTIEGPVLANQNYNEVRITVGRDATTIEVVQGYQDQVVSAKTYPNNADAYGVFLRALQLQAFTKGDDSPNKADERGYCPTGDRFVYEVISGAADQQRYWLGSCGVGTFKGNAGAIRTLFARQVPDYSTIVGGLSL